MKRKRKARRKLAFKWAKQEIKRLGVPRRQLSKFVTMFRKMLRDDPNFTYKGGEADD